MTEETKRKGRGLGKKPALVYLGLRLDKETVDFFTSTYDNRQAKMREVLSQFIAREKISLMTKEQQDEQQ